MGSDIPKNSKEKLFYIIEAAALKHFLRSKSYKQVAEELDVSDASLCKWNQEMTEKESPSSDSLNQSEREELARLRRENKRLKMESEITKNGDGLLRSGSRLMKYQFIDAEKTNFPITVLCGVMGVSRSGFYAFKQRVPKNDALMKVTIKSIHSESKGTYGAPRIHRALQNQGFVIGHNRVSQVMRELNISGIPKRRRNRSRSKKVQEGKNLLQRNFAANAPNKVWCVDISYISTRQGWLYLAVVIDLFSRRIVGYEMDNHQRTSLPLAA